MSEGGIGWVPDADGPGRLRPQPFGLGQREQRLAVGPAAERGAAAELLVLLHRRPVRRGQRAHHRRRPHHGGERLPARRLVVARHPAGVLVRQLGRAARRRAARGRRRQRGPAVPPPAARQDDWRTAAPRDGPAPLCRPRGRADRRCRRPRRGAVEAWAGSPTSTGRASTATRRATSTSSSATPRYWRCRSATWPVRDRPSTTRPRSARLADAQPGGSDPVARLLDMDAEGIDQAVLYPSIGLYFSRVTDPAAAIALAARLQRLARRLLRAATPPALRGRHAPAAGSRGRGAAELRRAVERARFRGRLVRPNPCLGRSLSDRAYDAGLGGGRGAGRADRHPRGRLGRSCRPSGSDRPFNP